MHPDWSAVVQTLRVAAAATAISLALGIWLGRLIEGRRAAILAASLPLALPPTVVCGYFLVREFTEPVAVVAATLYGLPFLARSARLALESVDRRYLDAARIVGASEWRVFWRISLPLAIRPVLAAASIVFVRIGAEYAATLWIARLHSLRP
jgi:molybdate transport system permease protein